MTRRYSTADEDLSAALAEAGIAWPPRKVERVRQSGLTETRTRKGLGYPGGSRSEVLPDERERAISADHLLDKEGTYDRAVVAMFMQGVHKVARDKLARAVAGIVDADHKRLARHAAQPTSHRAAELAQRGARYAARARDFETLRLRLRQSNRQWRVHEGGRFIPVVAQLESLFEDAFLLFSTGRATSTTGLRELLDAFRLSASVLTDRKLVGASPLEAVVEALSRVQPSAVTHMVTASSIAELERARNDIGIVRRLARRYAESAPTDMESGWGLSLRAIAAMTDAGLAYCLPAFVWLRHHHAAKLDQFLATCDDLL
jgi:hypothetical protein